MALGPRLDLRIGQSLVITPQLRQAIELLQLSNLELADFVAEQVEKNPLLSQSEADGDSAAPAAPAAPDPAAPDPAQRGEADSVARAGDAPLDTDFDNVFDRDVAQDGPAGDSTVWRERGGGGNFDDSGDPTQALSQTLTQDRTLAEHLRGQIMVDIHDPSDRLIALHLVEMLDEAGYVTGDLDALAEALGCDLERIERVLNAAQALDPPGVFARSLKECLAAQLRERDRLDPAMAAMLDHLDLLASRKIDKLSALCGVDSEDIVDMVAEIRSLDPKPGLAFANDLAQTVVPEVLVRRGADGDWLVDLNTDTLPRLLIDKRYHARVGRDARTPEARAYLSEQLQSANWLIRALDQRANTILKVASALIAFQRAFFEHGVAHLKPLILRDIAEQVEMHESTISRVTSNKFMATPRGIFEMKYFFTTAIAASHGGEAHSAEAVRHKLKALIDNEDPAEVLSDDRLVALLSAGGVEIARRTVAKYREAMKIPSSVRRRQLKRAQF